MAPVRLVCFVLLLATVVVSAGTVEYDCSKAPPSWEGANAQKYQKWCEYCGGTFQMNPNPSCSPGVNWGKRNSPGSTNSGSGNFYDYQADRQRREAEAQRQRDQQAAEDAQRRAEEQQRKDAEFKRKQAEIFSSMKDISEKQLGTSVAGEDLKDALKDIEVTPPPKAQFKATGPDCNAGGPVDSKIVDLRCLGLNPDEPIKVDPWVVKGRERVFPAQIDPATFLNVNYNKGFDCLLRFDPASAVRYFELAKQQRPKDPLVRNALLLAQDLVAAHAKKDREDRAQAEYWRLHTFACLGKGQQGEALASITRASDLNPKSSQIRSLLSVTQFVARATNPMDPPQKQRAYVLVGHAIYEMNDFDWYAALGSLEAAQRLAPKDTYIPKLIQIVHGYMGNPRTTANDPNGAARKDILNKAGKN